MTREQQLSEAEGWTTWIYTYIARYVFRLILNKFIIFDNYDIQKDYQNYTKIGCDNAKHASLSIR